MEASVNNDQLADGMWSSESSTENGRHECEQSGDSQVTCLQESGEDNLDDIDSCETCSSATSEEDIEFTMGTELVYAFENLRGSYQAAPSDEASLQNILRLVQAGFPSYGSVNHEAWQCKPCDFTVHRRRSGRSCRFGVTCMFCHGFHRRKVVAQRAGEESQVGLIANVVFAI